MNVLAWLGFFQPKRIPAVKVIPIALGFVGYIVLCNVSLQINSVGFYQVSRIPSRPEGCPCSAASTACRIGLVMWCRGVVLAVGVRLAQQRNQSARTRTLELHMQAHCLLPLATMTLRRS
jgi:hypothetical protein